MTLDVSADTPQCALMAELIDLLGEMPEPHDRHRANVFAERLDRLDAEAREREAPGTTVAAIRGARVLLDLAELPPLRAAPRPNVAR